MYDWFIEINNYYYLILLVVSVSLNISNSSYSVCYVSCLYGLSRLKVVFVIVRLSHVSLESASGVFGMILPHIMCSNPLSVVFDLQSV